MSADQTKGREAALVLKARARPAEYQKALKLIQEHAPWCLQSRDGLGRWRDAVKCIDGRTRAHEMLEDFNNRYPKEAHRVLPQNEAQKFLEGYALALEVHGLEQSASPPRPAQAARAPSGHAPRRPPLRRDDPDWKPIKRRFWVD